MRTTETQSTETETRSLTDEELAQVSGGGFWETAWELYNLAFCGTGAVPSGETGTLNKLVR
jgi:bacteriocin-like protein